MRHEPCFRAGKLNASGSTAATGAWYGTNARLKVGCVLVCRGRVEKHQNYPL